MNSGDDTKYHFLLIIKGFFRGEQLLLAFFLMWVLTGCDRGNTGLSSEGSLAAEQPAEPTRHDGDAMEAGKNGLPRTRVRERVTTRESQKFRGVARQLDDLDSRRRFLEPAQQSKQEALNALRGVPVSTPINIETDTIAGSNGRSAFPGEQEALNEYLLIALELQMLDAKEKIYSEHLDRPKATRSGNSAA